MSLSILIAAVYVIGALLLIGGPALAFWLAARAYIARQQERAALDRVVADHLDAILTEHYAGVVSWLPDAYDAAGFWNAVRNEGLHDAVAVQEGQS